MQNLEDGDRTRCSVRKVRIIQDSRSTPGSYYRSGLFDRGGSADLCRLYQSGRMQQPTGGVSNCEDGRDITMETDT